MGNSSSANRELAEMQEIIDKRDGEISQLLLQIETLESQKAEELKTCNDKIPALNDEIAKYKQYYSSTNSNLNDAVHTLGIKINTIREKDTEITKLKGDITTRDKEITKLKGDITTRDKDITKLKGDITTRDNTIKQQNTEISTWKSCEDANDKIINALRKYQTAPGFVKVIFDNKDWMMYIVNDFDKNWRTNKWFKYIWNVAITFKNTTRSIILFLSHNGGISPIGSPANFKAINKGFIDALAVDPQLTAYNMNTIITNPLLASKYYIRFWGAYRQKKGDDTSYTYTKTLNHDQTGDKRHDNLNQTTWMWNWMNTVVYDPKKYPNVKATEQDVKNFANKGRIVGTVNVTNNDRDVNKANVTKADGFYVKRPTAAG